MKLKIAFVIVLSVFLAVILASCDIGNGFANVKTDSFVSSFSEGNVSENPNSSSSDTMPEETELVLYENGEFNFTLTRSEDLKDLTVYAAFLSRLKQISDIERIKLDTDVSYKGHEYDPEKKEILFGYTKYPESAQGAEGLGFYEYRVSCIGNKIVISVRNDADIGNAASLLINYIRKNEKDGRVVIPKDLNISAEANCEYPLLSSKKIPTPSNYTSATLSDCGDGYHQATLHGATAETFTSYKKMLSDSGFTLHAENDMAGNVFATYVNGSFGVHTYFVPEMSEMRIIAFENVNLPSTDEFKYTKVTEPSFTLIGVEKGGSAGGLGCFVQLEDGSFIIFDGGYNNATEAKNLAALLKGLAPDPNNVIIRAWYITHAHGDHYGTFLNFSQLYAKSKIFTIESFVFNFCDTAQQGKYSVSLHYDKPIDAINTYWKDVPIYKGLTGQVYKYAGCDIEILYCMSDFLPMTIGEERSDADLTSVDGNLQTMVFRLNIAGQKILISGDTSKYNVDEMCDMYGEYLKSDMITVPHHGHNRDSYRARNGTIELYQLTNPAVVFWPAGVNAQQKYMKWNGKEGGDYEANHYLINNLNVKKVYIAGSTNVTVTLPHNP